MVWFSKPKYTSLEKTAKKKEMPEGLWTKCPSCEQMIFTAELERNLKICPKCDYYFTLRAEERLELVADEGSFRKAEAQERTDPERRGDRSCSR